MVSKWVFLSSVLVVRDYNRVILKYSFAFVVLAREMSFVMIKLCNIFLVITGIFR